MYSGAENNQEDLSFQRHSTNGSNQCMKEENESLIGQPSTVNHLEKKEDDNVL
jgi:hypothetical protein